ncbi:MAG: SAM-dependent chlorinase/fluorinase [Nocardiopsaceae bacterium]|nr:SAM-dependent chlorinase/fluorinase [Nocardiopsaceae bacterium]
MASFHCLTFLTDYGLEDGFVAACHGVGFQIAPNARIIDITHLVPPGDIRRGAAVLTQAVPYLPRAVHVAVVDPGVGTSRRGIAVASASGSVFVGPDNGLLSWAVESSGGAVAAVSLTNRELWLDDTVPATFHGRDIFMPAGAHLAAGTPFDAAGSPLDVSDLVTLPRPGSRVSGSTASGEVLTVDRFGNVQLSITAADAAAVGASAGETIRLRFRAASPAQSASSVQPASPAPDTSVASAPSGDQPTSLPSDISDISPSEAITRPIDLIVPFGRTFGDVPQGEMVAYPDSSGLVAIAVNGGNADRRLTLPPGTPVTLTPADDGSARMEVPLLRPGP